MNPAVIDTEIVRDQNLGFWVNTINQHIDCGVENFVAAGRDLIEARSKLQHGDFSKLFAAGKLRIDQRTAQVLMKIARNSILSNPSNFTYLPPALRSLNTLASLDEGEMQMALASGAVVPTMTINDAKVVVFEFQQKKKKKDIGADPYDADKSINRIQSALEREVIKCPPDQLDSFWLRVADLLTELSSTQQVPHAK